MAKRSRMTENGDSLLGDEVMEVDHQTSVLYAGKLLHGSKASAMVSVSSDMPESVFTEEDMQVSYDKGYRSYKFSECLELILANRMKTSIIIKLLGR